MSILCNSACVLLLPLPWRPLLWMYCVNGLVLPSKAAPTTRIECWYKFSTITDCGNRELYYYYYSDSVKFFVYVPVSCMFPFFSPFSLSLLSTSSFFAIFSLVRRDCRSYYVIFLRHPTSYLGKLQVFLNPRFHHIYILNEFDAFVNSYINLIVICTQQFYCTTFINEFHNYKTKISLLARSFYGYYTQAHLQQPLSVT